MSGYADLTCLKCGEKDTVRVHIVDGSFSCSQCDEEWTLDEAKSFLREWGRIIQWVEKMPKGGAE